MKKIILSLIIAFGGITTASFSFNAFAADKPNLSATQAWETEGFSQPESVALDKNKKQLYVSSINGKPDEKNGKGFISIVNLDGKITNKNWVTGLNAPKGLAIHKKNLYIADVDTLVVVDLKTGKKTSYKAKDAKFLNDVAVSRKGGDVYISDTYGNAIYKFDKKAKTLDLWLKDEKLNSPNGLFFRGKRLFVGGNSKGKIMVVSVKNKKIKPYSKQAINSIDGLQAIKGGFLFSSWSGGFLSFYNKKANTVTQLIDLNQGSADFAFDKKNKAVYMPLMVDGKVIKLSIESKKD